jgi:hypothetical protein
MGGQLRSKVASFRVVQLTEARVIRSDLFSRAPPATGRDVPDFGGQPMFDPVQLHYDSGER